MQRTGRDYQAIGSERRDQLLAAARVVLSQHGYERATVSSIATRAQVAQGTFYLYFPSKEALPGALAEQLSRALGAATRRLAGSGASLDAAVDALVTTTWEVAEGFEDVLLVANRGIELCEDFDSFVRLTAPWREGLEELLRHLQSTGEVDGSLDVATTAYVVRDLLDRSLKARLLFGQDGYARATADLVRRALAAGR